MAEPDRARAVLVSGNRRGAPTYPALDGSRTSDVAIIGGGYTGLQAAYNLAKSGISVILIDACRFGDGASGRNGGQLGTGQRWWPEELEEKIGYERSKALFDLAEAAKRHLIDFAREHQIEIDYVPGQLNVAHKASYKRDYYENAEIAALRYGYPHLSFMDEKETQERLGSKRFHCGVRDVGTGHIHPLKLLVGLARVAANAGAEIFEMTKATAIRQSGGKVTIETERGTITTERALIACNGHIGDLEPVTASHVMPIRSFIGATAPLDGHADVLPGARPWPICASSCATSANSVTAACCSAGARPIPRTIRGTFQSTFADRSPRSIQS